MFFKLVLIFLILFDNMVVFGLGGRELLLNKNKRKKKKGREVNYKKD